MHHDDLDTLGDERDRRRPRIPKKRDRMVAAAGAEEGRPPKAPIKGKRERVNFLDEIDPDDEYDYPVR